MYTIDSLSVRIHESEFIIKSVAEILKGIIFIFFKHFKNQVESPPGPP